LPLVRAALVAFSPLSRPAFFFNVTRRRLSPAVPVVVVGPADCLFPASARCFEELRAQLGAVYFSTLARRSPQASRGGGPSQ
jgi:hypothetical protein